MKQDTIHDFLEYNDISEGMYPHERKQEVEQTLCGIHTGLDWLVEHAKLGDLSWSDLQEIKDNIKILEAKCNG